MAGQYVNWHVLTAVRQIRKLYILIGLLILTLGFIVFGSTGPGRSVKKWSQSLPYTITSSSGRSESQQHSQPLADGIPLRVMFLGASITRGDVSTDNLGYRKLLHDNMTARGNPVNFVGSQRVGRFTDNDLEAYPGNRVDQIHEHARHIVGQTLPNLFVLHVGTNDCLQHWDTANVSGRMRAFIDFLLDTSPRGAVVMSTLLTNTVTDMEPCILDVNIQIRKLASALQRAGEPIVMAEMHYEQGLPDRLVPEDISPDGTHPFDKGYARMADIFWEAIIEADRRGFLQRAEENGIPENEDPERDAEGKKETAS